MITIITFSLVVICVACILIDTKEADVVLTICLFILLGVLAIWIATDYRFETHLIRR